MTKQKRTILSAAIVFIAAFAFLFYRALWSTATLFLNAAVQAYLFFPLVKTLEKRAPRTPAVLLAFALTLAANAAVITLLFPVFYAQGQTFLALLPQYKEKLDAFIEPLRAFPLTEKLLSFDGVTDMVSLSPQTLISFTATSLLLPILIGYLLRDRDKIAGIGVFFLPESWREPVIDMVREINRQLRLYVTGEGLTMLFVSLLTSLLLGVFGFEYWLVLGVIMGVTNVIPYIGPVLGSIPILLTAAPDGRILTALAIILVVQQIDNYLIHPRLISGMMRIHPAIVLLVLTAGGAAGSLIGLVLAIPFYIVLRILFREFYRFFTERRRNILKFEQI